MTDQEKLIILRGALDLACQFIRNNPPGELDKYPDNDYIAACASASNDPEGKKWRALFIRKAMVAKNEETDTVG